MLNFVRNLSSYIEKNILRTKDQIFLSLWFIRIEGFNTHMRLLRDKQPVKCWQPFSLGIGAQDRNAMYILKQIREGDCLQEYMLYHGQHKPLFTP